MRTAIVDTGPLIAFLDRAEQHHRWVAERIEELNPPLLVCEPVLAVQRESFKAVKLADIVVRMFGLLENGALRHRVQHRRAYLRRAQAASEISGQADVAGRWVIVRLKSMSGTPY
jgi:hypothetical protein